MPGPIDPEEYMKLSEQAFSHLDEDYPVLWRYMLKKRYIVPGYRQADYYSQKLCDYMMTDSLLSYMAGQGDLKDHVGAHITNSLIAAMHCGRPTLWLEKELGFPLVRTKLPPDFYLADLHWKWPALRVYLPKGLLTITRNGVADSMMYIDLTFIKGNTMCDLPADLHKEMKESFPFNPLSKIPILYSPYDGMSVTGILAMDSQHGPVGYTASTKFDKNTILNLMGQVADRIASPTPTDELDQDFLEKMLAVGLNILMFMGTLPEMTPAAGQGEEVLRRPAVEGRRQYSGLYAAQFVGQLQFRKEYKAASGNHTGRQFDVQWRAGHWKRVPVGKGKAERRLTWINMYHTLGYANQV